MNIDETILPIFLKELVDRIENKTITQKELNLVGEFYMSFQFNEQLENDNNNISEDEFSKNDLYKFIVLGWYIYNNILQENTITNTIDDDID